MSDVSSRLSSKRQKRSATSQKSEWDWLAYSERTRWKRLPSQVPWEWIAPPCRECNPPRQKPPSWTSLAKFLADLSNPRSCKYGREKLACVTFLCIVALGNKTLAHTFLPTFDNANGRLLPGGGGVLSYMGYIGMCRCEGYGFQAVYSRIGYVNQSVWV